MDTAIMQRSVTETHRIKRLRTLLGVAERHLARLYKLVDQALATNPNPATYDSSIRQDIREVEARHDAILDELRTLGWDDDPR